MSENCLRSSAPSRDFRRQSMAQSRVTEIRQTLLVNCTSFDDTPRCAQLIDPFAKSLRGVTPLATSGAC